MEKTVAGRCGHQTHPYTLEPYNMENTASPRPGLSSAIQGPCRGLASEGTLTEIEKQMFLYLFY